MSLTTDVPSPYELTPDQHDIVAAVRDFAQSALRPHAVEWDQDKHFPTDVLEEAGALGLGGIYVRDDVGGSGLTRTDATLIFEELAKGDTAIAAYVSIHNMVAWMIDRFGSPELRTTWLPGLTSLRLRGSYCLTEAEAGSDAASLRTTAVADGDDYVINGEKLFISGAGSSAVYVVMARTGGPGPAGISALLVPADVPGLGFGANERKMGWNAQPTRAVVFEDVRVPRSHLLGQGGDGFTIAMRGLNGGRLNIGACSLGGAQWAYEQAVRHVRERVAFGRPLAENQSLVFRLADMHTRLEAARGLLRRAAHALDVGAADAVELCAMAKRFTTDVGFSVANDALQLHGGYGYLADHGIEKVVRDLRVHQILEGTNEIMSLIVGRSIVGRP
ncbi:acyl-CoA dehydrogenase family protein [Microbacterium sp. SORGH_AS_0888]|uniref:acyl-CoA dehydrogenase family protein n=1 Tax=Microbacterium sp. SORGH_AS_0888 TaxID=3041791 RepID=UPI0027882D97|nr:acyl-CoA dehydrogenase family protein [Microbacterium sp. SORGH_AS_0888]MDQ1128093.1 alkylation response protein AidB-like acyl-CoA dehydrogenase [Microbacterium sp. SORGH_AS_0888]